MSSVSLSSAATTFSLHNTNTVTVTTKKLSCLLRVSRQSPSSISHTFNPLSLRPLIGENDGRVVNSRSRRSRGKGFRTVCYAGPLTLRNLQWISTVSSVVLILARGTPVQKSFIVPLFALQAPAGVIAWIKGRYGVWSAFLALLVRLFFYIPGELELPFLAFLLVIVAPYEALRLRDTKEGAILSLLIAVYLAFQHFSRTSIQKSLDQGSIVATIAVVCITVVSLLLLI